MKLLGHFSYLETHGASKCSIIFSNHFSQVVQMSFQKMLKPEKKTPNFQPLVLRAELLFVFSGVTMDKTPLVPSLPWLIAIVDVP